MPHKLNLPLVLFLTIAVALNVILWYCAARQLL